VPGQAWRTTAVREEIVSENPTVVTAEHFRYLAERTLQEDAFLRQLKGAAHAAGIPAIAISPEQAAFMCIVLQLCGAREVVEVGTLAGYSAIAMARALPPDGRVRTIELLDRHADFATDWIARSDVAGRVQVLRGAGADILPTLATHSADAAFLDADKAGYRLYLEECLRIVRPRGTILIDNAFAFGQLFDDNPTDREVGAVREFNDYVASHPALHSIIVPIGDGCWLCLKKD
jgi:predicted O-methyltransferase YrrM